MLDTELPSPAELQKLKAAESKWRKVCAAPASYIVLEGPFLYPKDVGGMACLPAIGRDCSTKKAGREKVLFNAFEA